MKAYPIELRKRVLHAIDRGIGTRNQIAAMFSVSTFWIYKLLRQRKATGDISPRPQNQGRKAAFTGANLQKLDAFVTAHPDATLEEIKEHFAGTVDCSIVAIHTTLKRLKWNYKKSVTCVRAKQAGCSLEALVMEKGTALNGFDQACVYR